MTKTKKKDKIVTVQNGYKAMTSCNWRIIMRIYSTSLFKIYERDFEGNWDYLISEGEFVFSAIEGILQLNYAEKMAILEILERSNGIQAINLGDKTYGFEYTGEIKTGYKYRLVNARFEDISEVNIDDVVKTKKKDEEEQKAERKRKFKENMIKSGKWVEHKKED